MCNGISFRLAFDMRSDGTGVEVDYDEPGSPLDRYLANLDLEFHPAAGTEELSLAQQLHNVQAESPEQTSAAIKEDLSQIEQDLSPSMFASMFNFRVAILDLGVSWNWIGSNPIRFGWNLDGQGTGFCWVKLGNWGKLGDSDPIKNISLNYAK